MGVGWRLRVVIGCTGGYLGRVWKGGRKVWCEGEEMQDLRMSFGGA